MQARWGMWVQILTPKKVKWTVGKGNEINAENYVNRSGGSAVDVCMYDVCSDVFIQ